MIRFREFVDNKDNPIGEPVSDQTELFKRIVHNNGARFRQLLKEVIRKGMIEDDPDLLADIRELYRSMKNSDHYDQFPVRSHKPQDPDVVTRPKADGGSGLTGGGDQGDGE